MRLFFSIFGSILLVASCSNNSDRRKTNIQLYDKPLSIIKSHMEGKWQLHYIKGGFITNYVQQYDDCYWKFELNNADKLKTINGPISADTIIFWEAGQDNYAGETYIMNFYDKDNIPNSFIVDGIYNDTLMIHINSADAMFFYFTEY